MHGHCSGGQAVGTPLQNGGSAERDEFGDLLEQRFEDLLGPTALRQGTLGSPDALSHLLVVLHFALQRLVGACQRIQPRLEASCVGFCVGHADVSAEGNQLLMC